MTIASLASWCPASRQRWKLSQHLMSPQPETACWNLTPAAMLSKLCWAKPLQYPGCEKILPGLGLLRNAQIDQMNWQFTESPQKLKDQHQKLWATCRSKTVNVKSIPDNPDTYRHFQLPNLSSCSWSTWLFVGWTLIHLLYMAPSHGSATSFPMRFDDGLWFCPLPFGCIWDTFECKWPFEAETVALACSCWILCAS